MGDKLTRPELADMVEDGSIIGKCVEYVYINGPNREFPLYMEFTGYSIPYANGSEYVHYHLTNPNTEKYVEGKEFQFNKEDFIKNLLEGENKLESIRITQREPVWAL